MAGRFNRGLRSDTMLREVGVAQRLLTSAHYKQGPPSKLINTVSSPIYAAIRPPVYGRPEQKRMRRTTQAAPSTESMQSAPSTSYLHDRLKGNEVCAGQSGSFLVSSCSDCLFYGPKICSTSKSLAKWTTSLDIFAYDLSLHSCLTCR